MPENQGASTSHRAKKSANFYRERSKHAAAQVAHQTTKPQNPGIFRAFRTTCGIEKYNFGGC